MEKAMNHDKYAPLDSSVVPRFAGRASFMRAAQAPLADDLDIALVGVPLDLGATYRSGARHGPEGVRSASRLIRQANPTTNVAPYRLCTIADIGDAPVDPLSVERSVDLIHAYYDKVHAAGAVPISIGGIIPCLCRFCEPSRAKALSD